MPEMHHLILASGSGARKSMLRAAGIAFEVIPADVDEDAIRSTMTAADGAVSASAVAAALAHKKALHISRLHPTALVIGSDQVLAFGTRLFSKAETLEQARTTLMQLRGGTHDLISAVALACGGAIIWQTVESARLTMRPFSDAFLEHYLVNAGDCTYKSVGCYYLEGLGAQLFEKIEGDYFTILGMPLLPLLAELRNRGVVRA